MLTYGKNNVFAIYFSDGEYDSFRKCTVGICNTLKEAQNVVAALNLLHESELEKLESEVYYNSIYEEYRPSPDARFSWEELPVLLELKED